MQSEDTQAGASNQNENESGDTDQVEEPGLTSLGELLAQDEPKDDEDTPGGDQQEPGGNQKGDKLTKFNDLAGATDLELDALYQLEISTSDDGEPVTIETLKDNYAEREQFELERLQFEEGKAEAESELMKAQGELQEILQALPQGAVKPAVLEKIRARAEQQTEVERKKTLEVIKTWKDPKVREADIAGMTKYLQGYGYPVGYLQNVVDHRQLKFIRDSWQRAERMRKALEAVGKGKPKKTPQKKASGKPKKAPVTDIKTEPGESKLKAVFSNL